MHHPPASEPWLLQYAMIRGEITVGDAAAAMAAPATTTAGLISRLVDKRALRRGADRIAGRGRPYATYRLNFPAPVAVVQFNGSLLAGAVFANGAAPLASRTLPCRRVEALEQAVTLIRQLLEGLRSAAIVRRQSLPGLAVSINAVHVGQRVLASSVLPWASDALVQALATTLKMPVRVILAPAVLADYQTLEPPLPDTLVRLNVADGVSAHWLAFGQPYRGPNNLSGELGHLIADPDGPLCGCGRRGCLEAFVSGPAICRRIAHDLRSGAVSSLDTATFSAGLPRDGIDQLWQAWGDGDSFAHAIMETVFDRLAWGMGVAINLFDPDLLIVGGYVLQDRPAWIEQVQRRAQRWILHAARRENPVQASRVSVEDELRVIAQRFCYEELLLPALLQRRRRRSVA